MFLENICIFANLFSFFLNHKNAQPLLFLAFIDIRNGK